MSKAAQKLREIASIKTSVLYSKRAVLKNAATEIESLRDELKALKNEMHNLRAFEPIDVKRAWLSKLIDRVDAALSKDEDIP